MISLPLRCSVNIELINDPEDPRLDDYRNLTDAHLQRDRGAFIAEGRLIVRTLIGLPAWRVRSILVTEPALRSLQQPADPEVAQAAVPCAGGPPAGLEGKAVYLVPQGVMNLVAGFNIHRGCLASVDRPALRGVSALLGAVGEGPARIVVLEGLLNHDNVGGIFRSAAAFGAAAVLLSPGCVDPLYRKAVRVSMGGVLRVPFGWFGSPGEEWPGGLSLVRGAGFTVVALTPSPDAEDLRSVAADPPGRAALLLGAEGPGLTGGALASADRRARIGMGEGVDSLNVGVAAGIALFALSRREGAVGA